MIRVTTGDALHLYGSVGRSNYSVRLCVRMDENINSEAIVNALKSTHKRYPYLCVRLKKMALDRQCTAYRGMTFLQSDEENVYKKMVFSSSSNKMVLKAPKIEDKREAFSKMIDGGRDFFSYMVSYVGQWKYKDIGMHIREFWTHMPMANGFLIEIAAVNRNIFLSIHQNFEEDIYYKALLNELADNGIPYTERAALINDVAKFEEPMD